MSAVQIISEEADIMNFLLFSCLVICTFFREPCGSALECLTQNLRVAGSGHNSGTALCP